MTQARTWIIISGLTALFVSLGYMFGGSGGLILFAGFAVIFNLVMFWFSDRLALRASKARPVSQSEAPELYRDIEELAAKAGLPMPRVFLIPSEQPNAFATGRSPKKAAVAVTEGLLRYLPREQVRGVLAHELAHIANRDILVTTIAAMIGAAISAIANILQFSMFFGGGDDEDNNPLGIVGILVAIIVAPLAAMILQLAVSRQREYLADATGAQYLGEGRPLAEALATLERGVEAVPMNVNPATEALYIANPLSRKGMAALFSTHPPMAERIRRLRELDAASGIHY
jgi:heat shock protein HtpX